MDQLADGAEGQLNVGLLLSSKQLAVTSATAGKHKSYAQTCPANESSDPHP